MLKFVALEDIPLVKEIMKKLGGILKETGGNGYCESDVYMHYQLERVDIDIISFVCYDGRMAT